MLLVLIGSYAVPVEYQGGLYASYQACEQERTKEINRIDEKLRIKMDAVYIQNKTEACFVVKEEK